MISTRLKVTPMGFHKQVPLRQVKGTGINIIVTNRDSNRVRQVGVDYFISCVNIGPMERRTKVATEKRPTRAVTGGATDKRKPNSIQILLPGGAVKG